MVFGVPNTRACIVSVLDTSIFFVSLARVLRLVKDRAAEVYVLWGLDIGELTSPKGYDWETLCYKVKPEDLIRSVSSKNRSE